MKPLFHKVPTQLQTSFSIRHDVKPNFGTIWHYHPELELHYVIKGEGVRFIGDNIGNFSSGDMLFVGSNLPHTWRCKDEYFELNSNKEVEAVVIHFLPDCFGKDFLNMPETYLISRLMEKAQKGMKITGKTRNTLAELMNSAIDAINLDRLIILLKILKCLAETDEYVTIASSHVFNQSNELDIIRLNKIYTYTLSNYKKDISLKEISSVGNLSLTSFCRYFKLMTNKTYYDFLIEIRISHACRMLIENKLSIEIICFDCGFNNVSNFYRHFKKITTTTPLDYKKKYLN